MHACARACAESWLREFWSADAACSLFGLWAVSMDEDEVGESKTQEDGCDLHHSARVRVFD